MEGRRCEQLNLKGNERPEFGRVPLESVMDGFCTNPDNSPEKKRTDFNGEINKNMKSGGMKSQKRNAKACALHYATSEINQDSE